MAGANVTFVKCSGGPLDGQEIEPTSGWPVPVYEVETLEQEEQPGILVGHYVEPLASGEPTVFTEQVRA